MTNIVQVGGLANRNFTEPIALDADGIAKATIVAPAGKRNSSN